MGDAMCICSARLFLTRQNHAGPWQHHVTLQHREVRANAYVPVQLHVLMSSAARTCACSIAVLEL